MKKSPIERRMYPRYDTDVEIYFRLKYRIKTKVKFKILSSGNKAALERKYSGVSRNVSVEGLCFESRKKLEKGDLLFIEIFEPRVKKPVKLEGEVRWCRKVSIPRNRPAIFDTGVKLFLVNEKSVADSIYFDKKYRIIWSAVLDAVFGSFAATKNKSR